MYSLTRCLLLVTTLLSVSYWAVAQGGLGLYTITQSADSPKDNVPLPPRANVVDNSAQVEQNYNVVLVPVMSLFTPPAYVAPAQETATTNELRTQLKALRKLASRNRGLEQQVENRLAARKLRQMLDSTRHETALQQARTNLLNQLYAIKNKQLNEVKGEVMSNSVLLKQPIDTTAADVKQLRTYQTNYWRKMPDLIDKESVYQSDQAYHGFDSRLNKLEQQLGRARLAYKSFEKEKDSLTAYRLGLYDTTKQAQRTYNQRLERIQQATSLVKQKTDSLNLSLRAYNAEISKWETDFKAEQEKKKGDNDNLTALPALTSVTRTGLVIPAVSVIGSHRSGSDTSPTILSLKLFTALGGAGQAQQLGGARGTERLFIHDASSFGFSADAAFLFNSARKSAADAPHAFGIVVGASYLEKLMTPDSLHSFTTGTASLRLSAEFYIVPDVLMAYLGVNTLTFLTNRSEVTSYYTSNRPKDMYGFANAGIRAILSLSDKKNVSFLFDLGFILKGDNVRAFVPNDDFTITTIRATLAKNFSLH